MAAIMRLPVVFVCENNGYAVSFSVEQSTAGVIVERAAAYGLAAETVDGMDAEAVLEAASRAVALARAGEGPSFLECRTYRFVGHHTAERTMGLGYRSDDEIARWRERDPLVVLGVRMDPATRAAIDAEVEQTLADALAFARASARPDVATAADFVYGGALAPRAGTAACRA